MKNFPDQDPFNELERRLQDYTEQPDDLVWQNVDKALRPRRTPSWLVWVDRVSTLVAVGAFAFLVTGELHSNEASSKDETKSGALAKSDKAREPKTNEKEKAIYENAQDVLNVKRDVQQIPALFSKDKILKTGVSVVSPIKKNKEIAILSSDTILRQVDWGAESGSATETEGSVDSISTPLLKAAIDSSDLKNESPKDSKRIPKRGLTFYASITPQLSFQRIIPISDDGIVISEYYNSSIFSAERFGINIDAGVQGYIAKRLEYYGGFSIYQQRQTLKYAYQSESNISFEPTDDLSYLVTPKSNIREIQYKMLNLGAQVGVLYNLQGRKLLHKIGAGLSYQHGFKKSTSAEYDNSESSYLLYQVFYRNEIRIGAKLSVFVQPTFSHSIYTNEKLNAPFNLRPYRAGLGFGILYDF